MNSGLIKSLEKESAEQFRQRLDKLPSKKLVQELTKIIKDETQTSCTVLSYLVEGSNKEGSREKFRYSLEKLSQVEGFSLANYLNSYRVQKNAMFETSPLYLLAIFTQSTDMMQDLYDFGIDPNVTMTRQGSLTLDGDIIAEQMSTETDQYLVEKHTELKAKFLEKNLSNSLENKPPQKKVKL